MLKIQSETPSPEALNLKTLRLSAGITPQDLGLEFGPLDRPVLSKSIYNVRYVDHLDAEDLKEKYRDRGDIALNVNNIPYIDYNISRKPLLELIEKESLDFVVASHVIEHISNPIAWLNELALLLKPNGILSLAIPDKRFCFDFLRPLSRTEDLVAAYENNVKRPSLQQVKEHFSLATNISCTLSWAFPWFYRILAPKKIYSNQRVQQEIQQSVSSYVDAHCWVMTSRSFLLLLKELSEKKLLAFDVANFYTTNPNSLEFFVQLRKATPDIAKLNDLLVTLEPGIKIGWDNADGRPAWALPRAIWNKLKSLLSD